MRGDFNCRLGNLNNFDDLIDFYRFYNARVANDNICNSRGEILNDFMLTNGFIVLNGRSPGDHPGQYTCINVFGKSTVDFIWCTLDALLLFSDFRVIYLITDSDHFPIILVSAETVMDVNIVKYRGLDKRRIINCLFTMK